jgi:hypothetical protein
METRFEKAIDSHIKPFKNNIIMILPSPPETPSENTAKSLSLLLVSDNLSLKNQWVRELPSTRWAAN